MTVHCGKSAGPRSVLALIALLLAAGAVADSSPSGTADATGKTNPEVMAGRAAQVPVRFRGRTLFVVSSPIGELSPPERAAAIEQRLLAVAAGPSDVLEQLRVTERDGISEIAVGDTLIRAVTDQDALHTGRTRRQLAADQAAVIRAVLTVEFHDRSTASLLRAALHAVAATALFVVLLAGLRQLYRRTRDRITRAAHEWHLTSGLDRLRLMSPETVAAASGSVTTTLAWTLGAALLYFYLQYVLSLFPWTRGIAATMVKTARTAIVDVVSGVVGYLPNLINIVVIVVAARLALKGLHAFFQRVEAERLSFQGFYPEWAQPTYSLVRFLVMAISAVMIFPYLPGSGSAGFRGVSVFVGLLISLGAASAIANVIAGTVITYMRPFRVGDRVKIADAIGDVTSKDLFVVRLRTTKNVDITIPNSLVLANHIINFSSSAHSKGLILHTTVTIGYDAPWQQVHELLITAARRVDGILSEPAPFVLQTSLDDFYVSYELNAYTNRPEAMPALYSRLHGEIQNAFNEAGLEIMSPHFAAVRDGGRMAVPDEHLPRDYQAPAINLVSRILRAGRGVS
jgi:small-conductance mechanosensitive channel